MSTTASMSSDIVSPSDRSLDKSADGARLGGAFVVDIVEGLQ